MTKTVMRRGGGALSARHHPPHM